MTTLLHPSVFHDALQISPERISRMGDVELNTLMSLLLHAQAYICGSPPSEIRTNTEIKASDDGCDGWTGKGTVDDAWLGGAQTCWQFKAGSNGEPAKLRGEATKAIPRETLLAGGRFVVVASGSTNGTKGERVRRDKLVEDCTREGLPTDHVHVIGSERLATWCNQHPAVAARWAGLPAGLITLNEWARSDLHQIPWQASLQVQQDLVRQRAELDPLRGSLYHLHVQGPPGVGKTRFVLELCRGAPWCSAIIYLPQADDPRLLELIYSVVRQGDLKLVVVADEAQPTQLAALREAVGMSNGRIRLITIGHSHTPDPTRIPELPIRPLDYSEAVKVVEGWHPAMPREQIDFVVHFADGYVRLARLAANAIALSNETNLRGLLGRSEFREFFDRMLGTGDRRGLYVVAVLTSVGWTEDKQDEGRCIAQHLGLQWSEVKAAVAEFHRRLGIAPQGGRYRYISPVPLGIHLAVEAWEIYGDELRTLVDILPSDAAKQAYYKRLHSMASNPQAREYAREELTHFSSVSHFADGQAVHRWAALSAADPDRAVRGVLKALAGATVDERGQIRDDARRTLVHQLVHLCWRSSCFSGAVKSLCLLAEAENEKWANNAAAEFEARFQIVLGGTAAPYLDRLGVLDDLLERRTKAVTRLVIGALARAAELHVSRMGAGPSGDEVPEPEWRPGTLGEHLACIRAAIGRLEALIGADDGQEFEAELTKAALDFTMLLRYVELRQSVESLFVATRGRYPCAREALRRAVADVVYREKKYWKELPPDALDLLERLRAQFEDDSVGASLRKDVGQARWDREEQPDLSGLAERLVASPSELGGEWSWLTSGEASDAWRLGEALAIADDDRVLASTMPELPDAGRDLRVIAGYVGTMRKRLGDEWYDQWMKSQSSRTPKPVALLLEIAWRVGATKEVADGLVTLLQEEVVDAQVVGQLGFGRWGGELSPGDLEPVLRALASTGHTSTALTILDYRTEKAPAELEFWRQLALELVTRPELVRGSQMVAHHWNELAGRYLKGSARDLATAIMREHADRTADTWFAEHSGASVVLSSCVQEDPDAVWQALAPYLESEVDGHIFSIGFPGFIVDQVPSDKVLEWIAVDPSGRSSVIGKLIGKNVSTDGSLASRILAAYGDDEAVAAAFFSEYTSGMWTGSPAEHWNQMADQVDRLAARSQLPKLRAWAQYASRNLRAMAERDREWEEERKLRGR